MGLFDIFKKEKNPLEDEIVKKYFEIICGMRHTFLATGREAITDNKRAKNYVEYFLGTECDQEKLEKTLELYNVSQTDYPNGKTETILSDFRRSLTKSTNYTLDRFEAYKMFCPEEIEAVEIEYSKVLDIIKDNVNYKHFSQGIRSIKASNTAKHIVIAKSFCEGNAITQEVIFEYLIDDFVSRMNNDTYTKLHNCRDDIALLVLKALHFEKYSANEVNYKSISDDSFTNFVSNVVYYKKAIDDHPFEKESYIEKFANCIKNGKIIDGVYTSFGRDCFHITSVNDYFCDAVCNHAWKVISKKYNWQNHDGENISNSKNPQDIFDIICCYLENPEDYN